MQTCPREISVAELNLLLAAAARMPQASDQARETQRRVHGRIVRVLSGVASVVLLYDAVLVWAG